jgi:hypothetical protein
LKRFYELLVDFRLAVGISADFLTLVGALILARDAFNHLKDLQDRKINLAFRREFRDVQIEDDEEMAARTAVRMAARGFLILVTGFLLQVLSRLAEG